MRNNYFTNFFILGSSALFILVSCNTNPSEKIVNSIDGNRAYQDVVAQVAFGPRTPNSAAHAKTIAYIQDQLRAAGWQYTNQDTRWQGFSVQNIIASKSDRPPEILIGAHYDTRMEADRDKNPAGSSPVPGANDGASGVAVLLELARTIPESDIPVWLVFFDAEDNGGIAGRDWVMGSRAFVRDLQYPLQAAVIVDMVGDINLNIYEEQSSTPALVNEIWYQAAKLGYENEFIQTAKYEMLDDQTPFLESHIPAVDIIDFDYPFWHTTSDTIDKVSPQSLKIVAETLFSWLSIKK